MAAAQKSQPLPVLCLVLAVLTLAVFWDVRQNDFVNYDDPDYVLENPHVQSGLNAANVAWAFKANHSSNWHPITWISHMIDCELFGLNAPGRHHLTSLFFHTANALLLFLLLNRLTGAVWRSAVVAALFAVHPLRVESVAWVAERKDVLSTLFWMLTLLAYANYARSGPANPKTQGNKNKWYVAALVFFALGLMSKPMLVTSPCVLLLLDFWPLRRVSGFGGAPTSNAKPQTKTFSTLLQEKIPFFGLTVVACFVTVWAQKSGGSVRSFTEFPLSLRVENAFVSYVRYMEKMFWPVDLAVFYPHPNAWPAGLMAISLLILLAVTFAVLKWAQRLPFLPVGWFWFIGTLVPVIGIVQVGIQSMADRYTYVPMIGLYMLIVWGAAEIIIKLPSLRFILAGGAVAAIAASSMITHKQLRFWRNSETLFRHALAVTKDNYTAEENLGIVLARKGREGGVAPADAQQQLEEAKAHFEKGLAIYPEMAESHHNLGNALLGLGKTDEAKARYEKAVELKQDYAAAYMNLGLIAVKQERMDVAARYYGKVVELKPDDPVGRYNYGTALLNLNKLSEAAAQYTAALQLQPDHFQSLFQLGNIANLQGRRDEAINYFRQVVQLKPDHAEAQSQLMQLGALK